MNVWIFSNHTDWEYDVIKHFKNKGLWNNVVWTSEFNPEKEYVSVDHFLNANYPEYTPLNDHIYNKIYQYLYVFIDMYCRNSHLGQNQYDEKNIHDYVNIFNLILNYYNSNFKKNKIELVIFNRAPHVGYDFLCYLLAKELGIKTLILEQSLHPNKFFYYWEHFDYGNFKTSNVIFESARYKLELSHKKDLFYMKKNRKRSLYELLKKIYHKPYIKVLFETLNKNTRYQSFYRLNLKRKFSKFSKQLISSDISLEDDKFVYFPLHLQPEKTTSSWGGMYNDQLLALEKISTLIPKDWKIYVKENPKQTYFMRGKYFYDRLLKTPKVLLVPSKTNTYDLIEKSQFVSTITGTVGWEAITGGKSVLIFGWGVWYKKFPGVFQYSDKIKIDDLLSSKISIDEIEEKYNNLLNFMGEGVVYNKWGKEGYSVMVDDYSKERNIELIINSLDKILQSIQ